MLNDPKAISHVLQGQTISYHIEESLRQFLIMVTGQYRQSLFYPAHNAFSREGHRLCWWLTFMSSFFLTCSNLSVGPDHARQRKLLQPAFSPAFIKTLTPQVVQCANRVSSSRPVNSSTTIFSLTGSSAMGILDRPKRGFMGSCERTPVGWTIDYGNHRSKYVYTSWLFPVTDMKRVAVAFGLRFGIIEGERHELAE